jgi:putative ABC transport system permease protein
VIVTALATAVSMTVSVGIMVGSFRQTVDVWLARELQADLYMRAAGPATAGIYPPMDPAVTGIVENAPGVADVDVFHAFTFHYDGSNATFGAGSMDVVRRHRALSFLNGNADSILSSLPGRDRAIVSEPFANKHRVRIGDVLGIPLGGVVARLEVAGIYFDYSNDRGYVLVDGSTLRRYSPGQPPTSIAVYLKPGFPADAARASLETALSRFPVAIAPNSVLRRGALQIFDRTFEITNALEGVAIVIAMLGATNSLLALVLDRRREIGVLRYLGADRRQVRSMVLTEAALLGLLAETLGVALGTALSLVLIYVVNKQSFGWTIQFHAPAPRLAGALLLIWIVTVLAGLYPARYAAKMAPADVVHEE